MQATDFIPPEFRSSIIQAKGYASYNEILNISPTNTYNQLLTNEVIKFQFKTPDYLDPYDIYFDVVVESVDPGSHIPENQKTHRLYLDGSSSQLFQEIQIYSRSRHVETIRQHDQVMSIVESVGFDPDIAASQTYLGYNINNPIGGSARQPDRNTSMTEASQFPVQGSYYQWACAQFNGYKPTKSLPIKPSMDASVVGYKHHGLGILHSENSAEVRQGSISYGLGASSWPSIPFDAVAIDANSIPYHIKDYAPASTPANRTWALDLVKQSNTPQRCELSEMFDSCLGVQGCNKPLVYKPSSNSTYNTYNPTLDFDADDFKAATHLSGYYQRTHNFGYQSYWSAATSEGNKCQYLDYGGYGQSWLLNGKIQNKPVPSNKMRLNVPLNSGVMGTLLPEHKLIPGKALGDVEIQVRLNPYAFFASGLSRVADTIDGGKGQVDLTQYQLPRSWRIKDIQLVIHTYSFDQAFTQQLENQLSAGITLRSNGFDFAQSTSVADTRFLQGSWPIITGIQSLKALYVYFLDESYLRYTFCRKNFRLSGNVTMMQLKLNADYYPRRALQGHAGNPIQTTQNDQDNSEFIVWYQKQLGLYNSRTYTSLNRVNFAINERSYDPDTSETTIYPNNSKPNYKDYLLHGTPGQEEQRFRGQALYPFAFVQKPQKANVLQGIDVSNLKPFEVLIKTDQVNYYPKPVTLMMLQHFNIEVNFTDKGVTVYGYA